MPSTRYRYDGEDVVNCPQLHGLAVDEAGNPVDMGYCRPGQVFLTSYPIHNSLFTNLDADAPAVIEAPREGTGVVHVDELTRAESIVADEVAEQQPAEPDDSQPEDTTAPQEA